jgi:hypothetical protein
MLCAAQELLKHGFVNNVRLGLDGALWIRLTPALCCVLAYRVVFGLGPTL